uniref:Cytokine receptor common subunit beta N-terminal domain-containing protein n=1 Tax=Coturnix japonica TaxID=93934 RepID=A0A8C2TNZ8_COTJA
TGKRERKTWGTICHSASLFIYIFFLHAISESVPMKSLKCHSDYNSLVTCTWKEHSEAHTLLGLTLYQRNDIKK